MGEREGWGGAAAEQPVLTAEAPEAEAQGTRCESCAFLGGGGRGGGHLLAMGFLICSEAPAPPFPTPG